MNYSMIIYFLAISIRITFTLEYNNDDEDDDDEKQVASQSCTYHKILFYVFLFDPSFPSYQHCQVRCFQSSVKLSTPFDHDQSINISDRNVFFYIYLASFSQHIILLL